MQLKRVLMAFVDAMRWYRKRRAMRNVSPFLYK